MLKKLFRESSFLGENWQNLFLKVLFWNYGFLIFWEYALPGMVREIFNPEWLLLGMLFLFLFKRKQPLEELFSEKKNVIFILLLSFFVFLNFFDWLAVGFWSGLIFSIVFFLILKFFSESLSEA